MKTPNFIGFMSLGGDGAFPEVFRGEKLLDVQGLMMQQIPDKWNDFEDVAAIYNWPDGEMVSFLH